MNIETEKNRLEDIWFSFQFNNNVSFPKCPLSIVRNCQELVKGKIMPFPIIYFLTIMNPQHLKLL